MVASSGNESPKQNEDSEMVTYNAETFERYSRAHWLAAQREKARTSENKRIGYGAGLVFLAMFIFFVVI